MVKLPFLMQKEFRALRRSDLCQKTPFLGYGLMPRETWEARARRYQAEVAERGTSALQIGKDAQNRLHACLIPYGDLDELSARENEITGGHRDYKQLDRDIVSMIPAMLNAVHQGRKGHEA